MPHPRAYGTQSAEDPERMKAFAEDTAGDRARIEAEDRPAKKPSLAAAEKAMADYTEGDITNMAMMEDAPEGPSDTGDFDLRPEEQDAAKNIATEAQRLIEAGTDPNRVVQLFTAMAKAFMQVIGGDTVPADTGVSDTGADSGPTDTGPHPGATDTANPYDTGM